MDEFGDGYQGPANERIGCYLFIIPAFCLAMILFTGLALRNERLQNNATFLSGGRVRFVDDKVINLTKARTGIGPMRRYNTYGYDSYNVVGPMIFWMRRPFCWLLAALCSGSLLWMYIAGKPNVIAILVAAISLITLIAALAISYNVNRLVWQGAYGEPPTLTTPAQQLRRVTP